MSDNEFNERIELLKRAEKELEDFLIEHPELVEYQRYIESNLDKMGNSENRMRFIWNEMITKLIQLQDASLCITTKVGGKVQ